jgi:hypothetical protein
VLNTDAVAADLVAGSGVIDDMEASTDVFGASDLTFLAAYQTKLGSARTNLSEDSIFMGLFCRYFMVKAAHV